MKKFLTVLLVIAVMFTFSFGSAFATTGTGTPGDVTAAEIAEFKAAIGQEAATLQGTLVTAGQNYMNSINFSTDDEEATVATVTVSKAVLQELVDDAVEAAQLALNDLAVDLQGKVDASNLSSTDWDTIDEWKALLRAGITSAELGLTNTDGYDDLSDIATAVEVDYKVAQAQAKADLKAAQEKIAGYTANLDKYSDYTDDWYVMANDTEYGKNGSFGGYPVATISGITSAAVKVSAHDFVEGVLKTQLAAINGTEATVNSSSTTASDFTDASTTIGDAVKIAKEIVEGHKIKAAPDDYYIAPVPTAEEIKADTTLDGQKATAIRQMKADLNSAAVKMETALKTELSNENKNAKPDAKKVSALTAAIAALDGQVAATEEVYTALINYCDSKTEIDTLTTSGKIGTEITAFGNVNSYATGANAFTAASGAEDKLKSNVVITENVDALEAEAALLLLQKDVNGQPLHNADALKEALEEQTEVLYKGGDLEAAKDALAVGAEAALVVAKANHVNYINGYAVTGFEPKDKNDKAISKTNFASVKAWNKVYATRTAAGATTVNGVEVVSSGDEVYVYDKAQRAELEALVAETEAAIKAATSVAEVKAIFAAAQEKYEDIATTKDHEDDWASGAKLTLANTKAGYGTQLSNYATYLMSTVDGTKYGMVANDLKEVGNKELFKAYTTDELAGKFTDAKAAMEAALMTKEAVKAEKANVEKLIDAIGTVTLDSKDAIVAAADALKDYNDIAGAKLSVSNEAKLITAKTDYEVLAAKALDDAFKALDDKTITVADAEAVEALRAQYDAYAKFCDDYGVIIPTAKTNDLAYTNPNSVQKLEAELSTAKVAAVREMMIKLPANPTAAQRAEVEAARAAYEALSLDEKALIVGTLPWRNLIDAEEALDVLNVYAVKALKLTASSKATKGAITVKWTVKGDAAAADGYQVWKSTKMNKGYKKAFTTSKTSYKNTKGLKKGTRYYYKVRAYIVVDGKNVYSDWSNKAYRVAK